MGVRVGIGDKTQNLEKGERATPVVFEITTHVHSKLEYMA